MSANIKNLNSGVAGGETGLFYRLSILAICFFVALLVAGALAVWLGGFFEPGSRSEILAQSVAQNVVGFIGAAIATAWIISRRPASYLGLTQQVGWRPFVGVVIVYLIGIPFLNQLIYYNEQLSLPASMAGLEASMRSMEESAAKVTNLILSATSVGSLISGILIIGVLTGLAEELFFRGALQRSLTAYAPMKQWSVWIGAVIFSAVHLQFFGFFPRLLLGAFFGYMLYSTGSIWPGVFAHALNNSLVVMTEWIGHRSGSDYSDAQQWGVAETGCPWIALASLIALGIFLYFCYDYFFTPAKKSTDATNNRE